jgi:streptogramin lyase
MLKNIQRLGRGQRVVIFILIFGGGLALLVTLTAALILNSNNSGERWTAVALAGGVRVKEFAQLPGDDAYPSAIAVASDGTVYTGSYRTGALWAIRAGKVEEIVGTRGVLGAVTGLTAGADGGLYMVVIAAKDIKAGVKRLSADGKVSAFATIPDGRGFEAPQDVALDKSGHVYVSDLKRAEVWRFDADGSGGMVWWMPPKQPNAQPNAPAGLAYDPVADALVIVESANNIIYRVALNDPTKTAVLYQHGARPDAPGFNGVTVTPTGSVYVVAAAQKGIARVDQDKLTYIAGLFRGPSDVAYHDGQLYVTNADAYALAYPGVRPKLPFGLDVITLGS